MQHFFTDKLIGDTPNEFIREFNRGVRLWIKREDLLHPEVSGNKFRKLKYNIKAAKEQRQDTLLTFGGAHSNHIAATAAAGNILGFKTIGVIRGDELENYTENWSSTLRYAKSRGMSFKFLSREQYREKESAQVIKALRDQFGEFYLIPEGGTNEKAIHGCEEILKKKDDEFDFICSSVGTGGTLSGIIRASKPHQKILGFSALKSHHLEAEIKSHVNGQNWEILLDYHFGGYAKVNAELIQFMNLFQEKYRIILDPVYTGKLLFGIFDLIKKDYFPSNSRILAIHTGGLQGIDGMNAFLEKKNLPQINV